MNLSNLDFSKRLKMTCNFRTGFSPQPSLISGLNFYIVQCVCVYLCMFILMSLVMMTLLSYGALIFLLGHLGPSTADACAYVSLLPSTYVMLFSGY
jgi:hypothetical protein